MAAAAPRPPRVSVLLPVRDGAPTLRACLRSVQRQTEADFECVIVDDGSRDGSVDVAAEIAVRDPRFVLRPGPRSGLVPALLRGLDACRGDYVARMDADDLMRRDRLRRQADALDAAPELAAVGCHVRAFGAATAGRTEYVAWLGSIDGADAVRREALVECPIAHPTWMARAAALRSHPWRDVPWAEDYDVVLRWLRAGLRVGVVPARLHAWREHGARLSRTDPRYGLDRFLAAKVHFLCTGLLRRHERYVLWGYGSTGRALVRALRGHGRSPAAIVELHPGRIGNVIAGAPVIAPAALAPWRALPLLVSVVGVGPRADIRAELAEAGYRDGIDFCCVA